MFRKPDFQSTNTRTCFARSLPYRGNPNAGMLDPAATATYCLPSALQIIDDAFRRLSQRQKSNCGF